MLSNNVSALASQGRIPKSILFSLFSVGVSIFRGEGDACFLNLRSVSVCGKNNAFGGIVELEKSTDISAGSLIGINENKPFLSTGAKTRYRVIICARKFGKSFFFISIFFIANLLYDPFFRIIWFKRREHGFIVHVNS
jgi:hypothetical protein